MIGKQLLSNQVNPIHAPTSRKGQKISYESNQFVSLSVTLINIAKEKNNFFNLIYSTSPS